MKSGSNGLTTRHNAGELKFFPGWDESNKISIDYLNNGTR